MKAYIFHLQHGELTLRLEDVTLQLGLPINGEPVVGVSSGDLILLCEQLLGLVPPKVC